MSTLQEALNIFRHRLMGNLFAFSRDKGLTIGQFGAMMHILHKVNCDVSDIGNDMGITSSAASQMLERLVQMGLVTRSEAPNDRRVKLVVLTDKGRQILHDGIQTNRIWLESLAQSMTDREQELVREAIIILVDKAQALDTGEPLIPH